VSSPINRPYRTCAASPARDWLQPCLPQLNQRRSSAYV
jgi:hypothetical protein